MDHNNLDVIGDFIGPLAEFLENFGIVNLSELPAKNISDSTSSCNSGASSASTNRHYQSSKSSQCSSDAETNE
jgi:hypothetical protein